MCKLTDSQQAVIKETISILELIFKDSSDAILVNERYGFIEELLALAVIKKQIST